MAIGVGQIGLSIKDWRRLTPGQFAKAYKQYLNADEIKFKRSWEQVRFMCAVLLSPHSKKGLKPQDICKFEWDVTGGPVRLSSQDIEKVRERADELDRLWGG